MKISYDKKTDFLEIFLKEEDYYEDESVSLNYYLYRSEQTDEVVGFGILNAYANLHDFKEVPMHVKVALYSWMLRKRSKLSQKDFASRLGVSISTVQRVEEGASKDPSVRYLSGLKKIEPTFDLNSVLISKIEESA